MCERGGRGRGYEPGSAYLQDLDGNFAAGDVLALLTRASLLALALTSTACALVAILACWSCVPNVRHLSTADTALAPVDRYAGRSTPRRSQHHAPGVRGAHAEERVCEQGLSAGTSGLPEARALGPGPPRRQGTLPGHWWPAPHQSPGAAPKPVGRARKPACAAGVRYDSHNLTPQPPICIESASYRTRLVRTNSNRYSVLTLCLPNAKV